MSGGRRSRSPRGGCSCHERRGRRGPRGRGAAGAPPPPALLSLRSVAPLHFAEFPSWPGAAGGGVGRSCHGHQLGAAPRRGSSLRRRRRLPSASFPVALVSAERRASAEGARGGAARRPAWGAGARAAERGSRKSARAPPAPTSAVTLAGPPPSAAPARRDGVRGVPAARPSVSAALDGAAARPPCPERGCGGGRGMGVRAAFPWRPASGPVEGSCGEDRAAAGLAGRVRAGVGGGSRRPARAAPGAAGGRGPTAGSRVASHPAVGAVCDPGRGLGAAWRDGGGGGGDSPACVCV